MTIIQEPVGGLVGGTSGRGAKASYQTMSPRDFDPRVAFVSRVSDSVRPGGRQPGRERNVDP